MNYKKIFLAALIACIVLSSVSAVSAGLFDFGDDSSNDGTITGTIKDSTGEYDMMTKIGIDENGEIAYYEMMDWDGSVEIELSGASDDQLAAIQEAIDNDTEMNVTFNYDCDAIKEPTTPYETNMTLEGNVLKIEFSGDYEPESDVGYGSLKVTSGNITIEGENLITITF